MTEDQLSKKWNDLRNAALGKGTTPNVGPMLAKRVAREWKAWREAYMRPTFTIAMPTFILRWTKRYRALLERVHAAGAATHITEPFKTVLEELDADIDSMAESAARAAEDAALGLARFTEKIAWGLGLVGGGFLLYVLLKGTRNGS